MFNKKAKKEVPAKPKKPAKQKEKKGMGLFGKKKQKLEPMPERMEESEMPVLQPQYDGISNPIPESSEPNASNIWGTDPVFNFGTPEPHTSFNNDVMPEWGEVPNMQSFGPSTNDYGPAFAGMEHSEDSLGVGDAPIFGTDNVGDSPNEYLMENDFVGSDITEDINVPEFNLDEFMTPPPAFTGVQEPPVNEFNRAPTQEPIFNMGDYMTPPIFDGECAPSDVVSFTPDVQEPVVELSKDLETPTGTFSEPDVMPEEPVMIEKPEVVPKESVMIEKPDVMPEEPVVIEKPEVVPEEPVVTKEDPLLKYYMDCPFDSERGSYIVETKEEDFLFDGAKDLLDIQRRAREAEEKIKYDEYMKENKFVFIDGDLSSVAHEIDKASNEDAFVFNGSIM